MSEDLTYKPSEPMNDSAFLPMCRNWDEQTYYLSSTDVMGRLVRLDKQVGDLAWIIGKLIQERDDFLLSRDAKAPEGASGG